MLARPGWHRPYRPYRGRRRGISGSAVFLLLLLVFTVEAAWVSQPLWRGVLTPTLVLAEAAPHDDAATAAETSASLLERANVALVSGQWPEAGLALDRAAELDTARPAAQIAAARMLLRVHRLEEAVAWARRALSVAELRATQREADRIISDCVSLPASPDTWTARIDAVVLHPVG